MNSLHSIQEAHIFNHYYPHSCFQAWHFYSHLQQYGYRVTDKLNGLFFKVPQRHMPEPCSGAPLRFCKSACSQDGDEAKTKFRHEGDAPTPGVYCRCRASLVWDFIAMQSQWPNVLSFFPPLNTWGLFGLCAAFKRSNLMSQNYHNILGRLQDT